MWKFTALWALKYKQFHQELFQSRMENSLLMRADKKNGLLFELKKVYGTNFKGSEVLNYFLRPCNDYIAMRIS